MLLPTKMSMASVYESGTRSPQGELFLHANVKEQAFHALSISNLVCVIHHGTCRTKNIGRTCTPYDHQDVLVLPWDYCRYVLRFKRASP